jgi:rhamnogalacturonyl hydrolase YesR
MRKLMAALSLTSLMAFSFSSVNMAEETESPWIERFDQYDEKQSSDYDGTGYVGPVPSLGYAPSHLYAWGESYVLKGYTGMYRATKETEYLDRLVEDADGMFDQLKDNDHDGFESWWSAAYSINQTMNGTMEVDSIYYKDSGGAYMADNWYPYPWYGAKGSVYRTDTEKAKGKYSTLVQNKAGEEFVAAYTIIPNYTPDKKYQLRFIAKNKQANQKGKVMVVRQDTGKPIKEFEFSSEKWEAYSFDFMSPKEAGVQLRVYLTNADGQGEETGTYYDEIFFMQYGEYTVHEGMALTGISEFADIVYNDENLKKKYGKTAKEYLKILEKNFYPKWERHWAEWEKDGVPMGVYKFPFDDTARMTQINEYPPFMQPSKGITMPHNQYAAAGRTLVNMYKATGKEKYLNRAERMGNFIKDSLREKDTEKGKAYVWNYWDNSGQPWDFGYFRYKSEDISHANIELGLIVDLNQLGKVFTDEDMQRFSNTFTELIWQGDHADPRVSSFVDGTGSSNYSVLIAEWVTLSQYDSEVRDITLSLLGKKDTFAATYGMNILGSFLRYNSDLLDE